GKDRSALGISDPIAQKWTNFTKQMDLAGATIFKTFVVGLAPLEKPLEGLSAAFVKFLTTFMNGPLLKGGIEKLASVLNQFTGKITAPKFMASVDELVSSTGEIAQAFGKLAGFLGYAKEHPVKAAGRAAFDAVVKAPFKAGEAFGRYLIDPIYHGDKASYKALLANDERIWGLPAGTLAKVWARESSQSLAPPNSSRGAVGPFQFMPSVAAQLGIDPRNPQRAAWGAARYLAQLSEHYHGNMKDALAAYNWGPAHMDAALDYARRHGSSARVPRGVRSYVTATTPDSSIVVTARHK